MDDLCAAVAIYKRAGKRWRKRKRLVLLSAATKESVVVIGRAPYVFRHRMKWERRLASLSDSQFTRRYRLDKAGFAELCEDLRPRLERATRSLSLAAARGLSNSPSMNLPRFRMGKHSAFVSLPPLAAPPKPAPAFSLRAQHSDF